MDNPCTSYCSIIIPVLNEAEHIAVMLQPLQQWRSQGHEVLLVDGGSEDATCDNARPYVDRIVSSEKGRAKQMNAGAAAAGGDMLLFLHADTQLPEKGVDRIMQTYREGHGWGRFDVQLSDHHPLFPLIGFMISLRSRMTGVASGDQAMFVSRALFCKVGGFPEQPLMEDIELSRRLKKIVQPCCFKEKVITSSRRWQEYGVLSTILLMWRLRLSYYLGTSPDELAQQYRFTVKAKQGMLRTKAHTAKNASDS